MPGRPKDIVVENKMSPRSGSTDLRQVNTIHKKGAIKLKKSCYCKNKLVLLLSMRHKRSGKSWFQGKQVNESIKHLLL